MPDQFTPEVPQIPAHEIAQLGAEVQRHQENPENRMISGQEIVKKSIQAMTQTAPAAPQKDDADSVLPAYAQSAPAQTKLEIEHLLSVAFRDGIIAASEQAMKSNPFVLDAFHDALAGRLYPELQRRGLVK